MTRIMRYKHLNRKERMKMSYNPQYVGVAPEEIFIGGYVYSKSDLITHLEFHGVSDLLEVWEIEAIQNVRMPKILLTPPVSEIADISEIAVSNAFLKKIHEKNSGADRNRKDRFKDFKF